MKLEASDSPGVPPESRLSAVFLNLGRIGVMPRRQLPNERHPWMTSASPMQFGAARKPACGRVRSVSRMARTRVTVLKSKAAALSPPVHEHGVAFATVATAQLSSLKAGCVVYAAKAVPARSSVWSSRGSGRGSSALAKDNLEIDAAVGGTKAHRLARSINGGGDSLQGLVLFTLEDHLIERRGVFHGGDVACYPLVGG